MKAKKSLGQHFLTSRQIIRDIIDAAKLTKHDVVLEIGPGKGILTEALLKKAGRVITIEKDGTLVIFLKKKFAEEIKDDRLELIHGDILALDPTNYKLQTNHLAYATAKQASYKLIANIPYYITGAFLKKMLSASTQPSKMVLLIQKEVAERIAKSKKESLLSISVKAYGTPRYVKTVSKRHFKPQPKVDSAILVVDNISKHFFSNCWTSDVQQLEKIFFDLVKTGFAHKRKKLITNLSTLKPKGKLEKIFIELDIPQNTRAEELSLSGWENLYRKIYS